MAERTRKEVAKTEETKARSRRSEKTEEKKETFDLSAVKWSIRRAHQFDNGNISFDLQLGEIILYRLIVVESKKGEEFISFPQYQNNGKWYNYFYIPFTNEDQDAIIDEVYHNLDD